MPNGLKVKADDGKVQRALQRLRSALSDLRPALKNASVELTRRIQYRFAFKRDPDGRRWSPWAASTKARYRGQKRTLMLHTKRLRDQTRFIPGKKDLRAVIGMPYGAAHEQPDGKPSKKLPRRAFLFSRRNGGRALAVNDEKYLLNAIRYQLRKAADQ